jgi:uncharacterized protein (TIGR03067 family)
MTRYVVTALVAGLLLAAAPSLKEDKAKKDVEMLQGTWRAVSVAVDGCVLDHPGERTITFEKDTFTVKRGGRLLDKGTYTLDPSKEPKAIDTVGKELPEDEGKTDKGIYRVDKDTFIWCSPSSGGGDRPTAFTSTSESKTTLRTYRKEKR